MEAIVLAGGRGSRLQSVVSQVPKPMADVKGVPFLDHLMSYWGKQGVTRFILSVGYRADQIRAHFGESFRDIPLDYAQEMQSLGTGGALQLAATHLSHSGPCLVLNGDTLFTLSLESLRRFHQVKQAELTIATKRVVSPEVSNGRYGGITTDRDGAVKQFPGQTGSGHLLINGGVYLFEPAILEEIASPSSLENEVIPGFIESKVRVYAAEFESPFLDIGVPEDYRRAGDFIDLI